MRGVRGLRDGRGWGPTQAGAQETDLTDTRLLMGVETWGADDLVQRKHVYERGETVRVAERGALGFQNVPHTLMDSGEGN